jgi:L-alanine-DL-glutamate epimerase-like enolase superfamily enzyme
VASGLGNTYVDAGAARVIEDVLAKCVIGADVHAVPEIATRMLRAVRNHGRAGATSIAEIAQAKSRATRAQGIGA